VTSALAGCDRPADPGDDVAYACSMKCEEEKTYPAPGTCPICLMDPVREE
jgi:hypothetical protein